jgi:hypothetical protein
MFNHTMDKTNLYKVVLVFKLTKSSADEELKRSKEETSFLNLLARQAGFIEIELVKINEEKQCPYKPGQQKRIGGRHWKQ